MGTVIVVVAGVLGEHCRELPCAEDECPVKALPAHSADPALGDRVGPRSQLHRMRTIGSDASG
jgi:hypothetical protein